MTAPERPPVSAIVTTYNEEENIGRCLDSLLWCDEVIVVDSYSTDRTVEIIKQYPSVQLIEHEYYGAAAQKNWAMDRTQHDWILIFDADEVCPGPLRREIEELLASNPQEVAYSIRRRAYFLGEPIRFSGWQHDQVVRLVRRGHGRYPAKRVHADMQTTGPAPLLRRRMDHYMIRDPGEYFERMTRYGIWGAAQGWRDGRNAGILEFLGRPLWRLFRTYILQLGILDGRRGLIFCLMQAYSTFVKYTVLWGWRRGARAGKPPVLPPFDDDTETWSGPDTNQTTP